MRAWAEQGLGITLLPEFAVCSALASGTLTAYRWLSLSLRLARRSRRPPRPT
jgi:DNA-binding transcriptional LysR family regulator